MCMTAAIAIEYVTRRMQEWGMEDYYIRFRHLRLLPSEQRSLPAFGILFLLVDPPADVRVESDIGIYDVSEDRAGELQYEHQGVLRIKNNAASVNHLRLIQVIPENP